MELRFVTKNAFKVEEVQKLLNGISIKHCPIEVHEIQTENIIELVHDKIRKAFDKIGRPVFIEHTSLHIVALNGFPGGLTQIFWDRLKADKFSELVQKLENPNVEAKTVVGYCDGKQIKTFEGSINGVIAEVPRGDRSFQWDCVFIPDGYTQTFAEMGDDKNEISMRKIAFEKFRTFLIEESDGRST